MQSSFGRWNQISVNFQAKFPSVDEIRFSAKNLDGLMKLKRKEAEAAKNKTDKKAENETDKKAENKTDSKAKKADWQLMKQLEAATISEKTGQDAGPSSKPQKNDKPKEQWKQGV